MSIFRTMHNIEIGIQNRYWKLYIKIKQSNAKQDLTLVLRPNKLRLRWAKLSTCRIKLWIFFLFCQKDIIFWKELKEIIGWKRKTLFQSFYWKTTDKNIKKILTKNKKEFLKEIVSDFLNWIPKIEKSGN